MPNLPKETAASDSQDNRGAASAATQDATAGQGGYAVQQGDCLMSISERFGFFWETIWNHADNSELRKVRGDAKVLYAGDRVTIPEKTLKEVSGATEKKHSFRRLGMPAKLRVQFLEEGVARANEPFTADVDGKTHKGVTDADGMVDILIPNAARRAIVKLGVGQKETIYELKLGELDPYDTTIGVQTRLNNIGLSAGMADGKLGSKTEAALRQFQSMYALKITGVPDEQTCKKLKQVHGS